jgi:hypothetical protein
MHQIRISTAKDDPVFSGTMHDGRISQVEVTRDGREIVVRVYPARNVLYRVNVVFEDGRPTVVESGGG